MTDSDTEFEYETVDYWKLTADPSRGNFIAMNRDGLPVWRTREHFITFMEQFGFHLHMTVDPEGKGQWTDPAENARHNGDEASEPTCACLEEKN